MFLKVAFVVCSLTSLLRSTSAKTVHSRPQIRSTYPFNQVVAFGDEFSDNGNGSYAHGITGSPANVYGFGTWTNGPVAVSFLATLLKSPLRDFAFGGCCGGGSFGATLDSTYTVSPAKSPSLVTQIANYTSHAHTNIKHALEFIWVGQNDLSMHTDAFWLTDPTNTHFYSDFLSKTASAVDTLLKAGAPYVFVANIYPKHLAPVTPKYLCGRNTECVSTWGQIIQNANSALQASLKQFGNKAIYYDVFGFMTGLLDDAAANGFTKSLTSFCDGDGDAMWDDCMVDGHAAKYFWMNFEQPTSRVHEVSCFPGASVEWVLMKS
jgi:phospholipase/lecithinase/hemolysin